MSGKEISTSHNNNRGFAEVSFPLTLFVSTPPYLALTLGSWIVSRLVPVTVIIVLPLRKHTNSPEVNTRAGGRPSPADGGSGGTYFRMVQFGSTPAMVGSSV